MRKEAKIAMSVFAFYLIFGLNELFGIGQRFIVPHILDDIILFIISIIFICFQKNVKAMLFPFSFTLFALFGFLSAPHAATLFDGVLNIQPFASFIDENYGVILKLFLTSFVFIAVLSLWIVWKYSEIKTWEKWLFYILAINILFVFPISFYLKWSFIVYAILTHVIPGIILVRNEGSFVLSKHHYAFMMLHFIASMLTILEYISLRGLIAF